VSLSAPAGTRTTCPLGRAISTTGGILGTFAGLATSVNTTRCSADEPFPSSAPASRKTRRHQLRVLGGIPRFSPNFRSVNPLRCQRANTRRISRARTDVVDPILPIDSYLRTHSARSADRRRRWNWSHGYEIFIDESGYTGEHHLDPAQPIFVLSSINLGDEITAELLAEHFTGVQAKELKHSRLAKRPNGQQRILDFIRGVSSMNAGGGLPVATAFAAHKKFLLLTLLVDQWVEPAMHKDGIDLYEEGANLGLSNMAFCVAQAPRL
jgi:hypothetical protein